MNRRKIFFDEPDRDDFLDRLGAILSDSQTPCFAWSLWRITFTYGESLDRPSTIRSLGYDFDWLLDRVLGLFGLTFKELLTGGKQQRVVQARSVLCYLGTRELGMSEIEISKKLNIAPSTASEFATRGRQIIEKQGLKLLDEDVE